MQWPRLAVVRLRTLRQRSILSHVLPVAIVVPLMGIALIYVLESQVLLDSLTTDLQGQALLAAQNAQQVPAIWHDDSQAAAFVAAIAPSVVARVMLLDPVGHLLASTDPADADRLGQQLQIADWGAACWMTWLGCMGRCWARWSWTAGRPPWVHG